MHLFYGFALLLILGVIAFGCRDRVEGMAGNKESNIRINEKKRDINNLESILQAGMPEAEIRKILGVPDIYLSKASNVSILTYVFSPASADGSEEWKVSGIRLLVKDGRVSDWRFIHSGVTETPSSKSGDADYLGDGIIGICTVDDKMKEIIEYYDKEGYVNASVISVLPQLETNLFKVNISLISAKNNGWGNAYIGLELSDEDLTKIMRITEDNIGKRVLIKYKDMIIAAPYINQTITSNRITLEIKNKVVIEYIKQTL